MSAFPLCFFIFNKNSTLKKLIFLLLAVILVIGIALSLQKGYGFFVGKYPYLWMNNSLEKDDAENIVAVYDPSGEIPTEFRHFTLKIKADSDWELKKDAFEKLSAETPVVLTLELYGERVVEGISQGVYDEKFKKLFEHLKNRQGLYLRFLPEMEIPASDKPWANWGDFYVKAFQHFSILTDQHLPEATVIWSPAGSIGNMEYFPGKDHFEVAALSLGAKDETDLFLEGKSLLEKLDRKLHRMRFLDTPILIFNKAGNDIDPTHIDETLVEFQKNSSFTNRADIRLNDIPKRSGPPELGVYDPKGALVNMEAVKLEHLFTDFEKLKNGLYQEELSRALSRNHDLIVTFEPMEPEEDPSEPNILRSILSGDYNEEIQEFYSSLPKDRTVYLRFMHEMEVPVHRYPWQFQDPLLYIKTFKYFMQFPQKERENIKKVWAPAGDRGSVEWWPGSDVVDYISMSIYGLPDKNITDFNMQDSFEEIYTRKKRRLDLFGKPFLIGEFGVKGEAEYQRQWLLDAAEVIQKNKEIFGVSYFNQQDHAGAWGDIVPPDWSVSPELFSEFTSSLEKEQ